MIDVFVSPRGGPSLTILVGLCDPVDHTEQAKQCPGGWNGCGDPNPSGLHPWILSQI